MALKDSYKLIHQMAADSYEAEMMKDPDFKADMERAELQTTEQEEINEFFVTFMKENNRQGMELTEGDLLASFRQAKQHTGYFAEEGILPPAPSTPDMER